jgi:hypothetical protein
MKADVRATRKETVAMRMVLVVGICAAVVMSVGCRKKSGIEIVPAGSVVWATAHFDPKLERYSAQNPDPQRQEAMGVTRIALT